MGKKCNCGKEIVMITLNEASRGDDEVSFLVGFTIYHADGKGICSCLWNSEEATKLGIDIGQIVAKMNTNLKGREE